MELNSKDAERLIRWFSCLEEDYLNSDGLLCFYETPRPPRVAQACEAFRGSLANPGGDRDP